MAGVAASASAVVPGEPERLSRYVAARAADADGDPGTAAKLFAELIGRSPEDSVLRARAVIGAIESGNMTLALDLGRSMDFTRAPLELRMLLIADELRRGRGAEALARLRNAKGVIDSTYLLPFVEAWVRADRKDRRAIASLDQVGAQSALAKQVDEHKALILLKQRRPAEALPLARSALENAGGRAERLRLAFADGFLKAGDRAGAAAMLDEKGAALAVARARVAARQPIGEAVDSAPKAFGELMLGLAVALNRMEDKSLSASLSQVALYANPDNDAALLLLGYFLDETGRPDAALQALQRIPSDAPFASQALDSEIRLLNGEERYDEALKRAFASASSDPSADAFSRLGAVYSEMNRFADAADAYGRAIAVAGTRPGADELWALRLFRASALEEIGKWEEAKAEVAAAMRSSPDNSMLLNFLGYGKLERGEDLDSAEAMIRKASALRPDDASITDSLGWAQFKRGKVDEAIETLQRAAAGDPGQAEIREHLGDALFTAGRRIEARFAWRAALVSADDEVKARIEQKIAQGLTPATAAP